MRPRRASRENVSVLGVSFSPVKKTSLMKYLIVDDDERIRRMIREVVADEAAIFCECPDGADARACYAEHRPDWVLMDLTMRDVDGLAATRQIRDEDPEARVVIVTAHDSAALREEARGAGACGYVLKENLLDLPELLNRPNLLHV